MQRPIWNLLVERLKEESPLIQVLLGPRQVGKTTGILNVIEHWAEPSHFASVDDTLIASPAWLTEQWQLALDKGSNTLLVIDEIQKIEDWSKIIKGLWDRSIRSKKTLRVVLLGSSSLAIQTGLSESLAGRFELINVPHWGFNESHQIFGHSLDTWLTWGGYPGAESLRHDEHRWLAYVTNSIVDAVIGRDILAIRAVKNPALFRQAFAIACGYPGQEISYAKFLGQLQDKGNIDLVKTYLELYQGAFLVYSCFKYSRSPRVLKGSSPKLILGCPALATLAHGSEWSRSPEGRGRVFESAVGAELLKIIGAQVNWWRDGDLEVDYIVRYKKALIAVEVKSGRRKRMGGMDAFLKKEAKAKPVFITLENFAAFSANPGDFILT